METSSVALFLALSAGYLGAANAESVPPNNASSLNPHSTRHHEGDRPHPEQDCPAVADKKPHS